MVIEWRLILHLLKEKHPSPPFRPISTTDVMHAWPSSTRQSYSFSRGGKEMSRYQCWNPQGYKQPHQSFHLASFPLLNDQRSQRRDLGQHGNPTRRERERHHRISICFLPPQGKMPLLWDQVKKDLVKFEKLIGFTKWLYSKVSFNLILVSGSNHTLECIGSNLPTNLHTNLCICLWLETEKHVFSKWFLLMLPCKTYPPQI